MTDDDAETALMNHLYPPTEAERSYLASLLWREDARELMWRSSIEPRHLESTDHARILEVMIELRDRGAIIHQLSVAEELDAHTEIVMWQLTDRPPNPAWVEFYAEQVMARYRRRTVGEMGGALKTIAEEAPGALLETEVERAVSSVLDSTAMTTPVTTDATIVERLFGERANDPVAMTPWKALNKQIKGFRPGALYTLSGDTGSGKSAVALQMAYALTLRGTVLYHSLEMSEPELQDRLVAQQCEVSLHMVERQHFPAGPVLDRVQRFAHRRTPIIFDDRSGISLGEIRRSALGVPDLAGIVVDYLNLMDLGLRKGENMTDALGRTTKGLKILAADLKVPVILLAQLNRQAVNSRPSKHHLLGSGAIANDSNVILLLHREDENNREDLSLIVDKNRYGEEGVIPLVWQGEFVRAVEPGSI